jgi:Skp family chaperone for outer membrane proteins
MHGVSKRGEPRIDEGIVKYLRAIHKNIQHKGVTLAMNFLSVVRAGALIAVLPALVGAQTEAQSQSATQPATGALVAGTKIAVIDIDRIAAESNPGKALFERLKQENDKLAAERARRQQEIQDMQAKLTSEVLSVDAREQLRRDVERKQTEFQRWLEDAQRDFQEKQQQGEQEFQAELAPVVERVAKENGIGLIFRATPGLTFVLDANLDITPLVVQALNQSDAAPPGGGSSGSSPK